MKTAKLILALTLLPAFGFAGESKLNVGPEVVVAPKGKNSQWNPAAAFDGKGTYLVVWSDGAGNWGGDADIHGVRVKASGQALDAQPVVISNAKDFQKRPRVAWTGKEWLVVWQDLRGGKDYDIYAARVSAEGKVLDADGIAVCTERRDQVFPAVASDGAGGGLVAWADFRGGNYDIWGTAVRSGKAGASAAFVAGPGEQMGASVAWTGKCYLVACANSERRGWPKGPKSLLLVRVGPNGQKLDAKPKMHGFGIGAFDSAMTAGGGRALLMGNTESGKVYHPNAVYGIFLDAEGTALAHDNPGRPMFTIPLNTVQNPPPITLCSTGTAGAPDVLSPGAAASGAWFLAVHQEATGAKRKVRPIIRHQLINAKTGKVVEDGRLTPAGTREKTPGAAGGPAGAFLVVYERNTGKDLQRVCARVVKVK